MNRDPSLTATVVITTRNRKEDLARALASCFRQTAPLEVLVIDDGSDDGTAAFVREQFPRAVVHRSEVSRGLIVQRNAAARLARGDVIFSIDDDAEFSAPTIVETVLREFSHPRIAAVAIPFINVRQDPTVWQQAPDERQVWLTNEFIGTAHAIRKAAFWEAGGYREVLFHQGEEGDLCIRLLDKGYFVRVGAGDPIYHHESPRRSFERINVYGQRNLMLFAWYNVPFPEVLPHLVLTVIKGMIWGAQRGFLLFRLRGTLRGLGAIAREWRRRAPVRHTTYRLYRRLKKRGPLRWSEAVPAGAEACPAPAPAA